MIGKAASLKIKCYIVTNQLKPKYQLNLYFCIPKLEKWKHWSPSEKNKKYTSKKRGTIENKSLVEENLLGSNLHCEAVHGVECFTNV
jgi:hypothetical protein